METCVEKLKTHDPLSISQRRLLSTPRFDYKQLLSRIVDAYDSRVVRAYRKARFTIININILHLLALGRARLTPRVRCGMRLWPLRLLLRRDTQESLKFERARC